MSAPAPTLRPTRAVTALSVIVALAALVTTLTFAVNGEAAQLSPAATETSESEPATTTTQPATTTTEPATTTTEPATTTTAPATTTTTAPTTTTTTIPGEPPSVPQGVWTVVEAARAVTVQWHAPADHGSSPVTGFVVRYRRAGQTTWSSRLPASPHERVVPSLENGTTYEFQVAAVNSVGEGPWTAPVPATTWSLPSAPRNPSAKPTTHAGELNATWSPPSSSGGAPSTRYIVERAISGTTWWVRMPVASTIPLTIRDLTPGRSYDVRVAAITAVGQGPWSTIASGVPIGPPSAPRSVVASARAGSVRLTWSSPATTYGLRVDRYIIQRRTSGSSVWTTIPTDPYTNPPMGVLTVPGLRPGTRYYFRVAAVTTAGQGAWSATPNAVPAPIGLRITATPSRTSVKPGDDLSYTIRVTNTSTFTATGGIQVGASWTDGSAYILAYSGPGRYNDYGMPWRHSITWAVHNLPPGATVTLVVRVRIHDIPPGTFTAKFNAWLWDAQNGPTTTVSATVLAGPRRPPSVPTNVRMSSGSNWAAIQWQAPTYYGSSFIDGYIVQRSTSPTGPWTTMARLGPGAQGWGDQPLTNVRRYYYRVVAYNDAGTGAFSTPLRVP